MHFRRIYPDVFRGEMIVKNDGVTVKALWIVPDLLYELVSIVLKA